MARIHVNEKNYETTKKMLNAGMTKNDVVEISGFSGWTVGYIKRSRDFEDYCRIIREVKKPKGEKAAPKGNEVVVDDIQMSGGRLSGAYITNRLFSLMEEQNATLKLISEKLAFIVEQLS